MSIPDHKFYNAFNLIPQIGPLRFKKLSVYFDTMENAWNADSGEYEKAGLEKNVIEKIIQLKKEISPEKEFEKLEKENIKIITINDELYPKLLKEIHTAPALLYYKGQLKKDEFTIAIVGSRKVSIYGKQVASQFARELSQTGFIIISGMAFGIDSIAHRECVKLKNRTIAVLGGGIDINSIYPSSNRQIANEIISEGGAIISEYPISTPPLKQHFPARNRIISGLSLGILVIEAAESSGTLITTRFALEQNREVFAVPGNIYSITSKGTNNLIKLGAKLVTKAEDISEELNLKSSVKIGRVKEIIPDNEEEALVLENLSPDESIHIDQLAKTIKMNTTAVSSLLTLMEIKGKVKNIGGMRYIKES
ncbi:MAG: DNA-processing protein DprA [Candidatus Andersenbacteria bacterium]|nr:DNA-processing protein DprA [Candidatus Andersenbacteria bacterium]